VRVTHFTESELKAQDEAYIASLPKPKPKPTPATPKVVEKVQKPNEEKKLTPEQEKISSSWQKVFEMIRKNRLTSLQQFWEREGQSFGGVDSINPEWTGERQMTMLQLASLTGQVDIVRWLLEEIRADPTIKVPSSARINGALDKSIGETHEEILSSNQTAYDISLTKEVRNVFRRCAGAHPDWWDWFGRGHIPATLTQEMEEKRDDKKRQRKGALKDKIRERMAQEKSTANEIPEPVPPLVRFEEPTTGPRKLGGRSGTPGDISGLTPEMQMKIERERRARAAEARMKTLSGR
jgi:hypothetical protein